MSNPRIPFQFAPSRPRLKPPNGKPLIVHIVVNVEHWDFTAPMPRLMIPGPHGIEPVPDVPNFSWAEYGVRCGLPRILRALRERGIRATVALNAAAIQVYPEAVTAMLEAGWEFMGHGVHQRTIAAVDDERREIRTCLDMIEGFVGYRPRGWLGPGLQETKETPDLLSEAGVEYVCDWTIDDLPAWMQTTGNPLIAMPYSLDLNDSVLYAVEKHQTIELYRRIMDTLEYLSRELADQPRVLTLPLHPHLIGPPNRMLYFERILDAIGDRQDASFMVGSEIADWYRVVEPFPA